MDKGYYNLDANTIFKKFKEKYEEKSITAKNVYMDELICWIVFVLLYIVSLLIIYNYSSVDNSSENLVNYNLNYITHEVFMSGCGLGGLILILYILVSLLKKFNNNEKQKAYLAIKRVFIEERIDGRAESISLIINSTNKIGWRFSHMGLAKFLDQGPYKIIKMMGFGMFGIFSFVYGNIFLEDGPGQLEINIFNTLDIFILLSSMIILFYCFIYGLTSVLCFFKISDYRTVLLYKEVLKDMEFNLTIKSGENNTNKSVKLSKK